MTLLFQDGKVIVKQGTIAPNIATGGTYTVPEDITFEKAEQREDGIICITQWSPLSLSDGVTVMSETIFDATQPIYIGVASVGEIVGLMGATLDLYQTIGIGDPMAYGLMYDPSSPTGMKLSPDAWGFGGETTKYISNIDIDNTNYIIKDKEARASIENKQDKIDDLDNIRAGAELGATALQTIPIARANVVGGVAGGNWLTVNQTTGKMECGELTKAQYDSANGYTFIGKTTLENVLTSKGYITNTNDCVHTTGDETVAGVKTFSSNPVITSAGLNINNTENGIIQHAGVNFLRNSSLGATIISATTNGTDHTIYLRPNGDTSTSNQAKIDTDGNLTATKFTGPLTGNVTGNCSGSSGSCTGNSATATKATQDSAGNTINTTYQRQWYSKYSISTYASSNPYIKLATVTFNNTTNYDISNLFWVEIQGADINMSAYALVRLSARWSSTAYATTKFEILEKYGQGASVFDSLVWAYKFTTSDSKASIVGEIWMKTRNSNYISYYFRPTQCNEYSDFAQSTVKGNSTMWTYYDKFGTSTAIASTAITSGYTQVAVTENFSSPKKQYSILSSTSNWNDFTNYGCYKVASTSASMVATYNAPVGEFGAGLLVVEKSYVSDEDRIVQIYYPNNPNIAPMWQRVRNGGNWRSWSPANAIKTSYVNGTSGYNIWYNGYCEQWGQTSTSPATITFAKTWKDTNFNIIGTETGSDDNARAIKFNASTRTTSSVKVVGSANPISISWKASGYLASGQY